MNNIAIAPDPWVVCECDWNSISYNNCHFWGGGRVVIPWQHLEAETLNNIIEAFVLREGTDYGEQEISLAQKVDDVYRQLKEGEVIVVWSELHETINIMQKEQFKHWRPE